MDDKRQEHQIQVIYPSQFPVVVSAEQLSEMIKFRLASGEIYTLKQVLDNLHFVSYGLETMIKITERQHTK